MQNKPNSRKTKMKLNSYLTGDYENKAQLQTQQKQTQSNPISKPGTLFSKLPTSKNHNTSRPPQCCGEQKMAHHEKFFCRLLFSLSLKKDKFTFIIGQRPE